MTVSVNAGVTDPSWKTVLIPDLAGGLNTTTLPDLLDGQQCPVVENLSLRSGRVRTDVGYETLGYNRTGHGIFRTSTIWESAGSKATIAITDETILRLVTVTVVADSYLEWQYVISTNTDYTLATTLASAAAKGPNTTITLTDDTGFEVGDSIGIKLKSGFEFQTKITDVDSAPDIEVGALPTTAPQYNGTGNCADSGAAVVRRIPLQGDPDISISTVSVPWESTPWVVFTNGVDVPLYYDGSYVEEVPNLQTVVATTVTCKVVTTFKGTLILANCILASDSKPNTILWSDIGDATEWVSNNAGQQNILEEGESITAMKALGPEMVIYGARSIIRMVYVGSTNFLFGFSAAVSGNTVGDTALGEGVGTVSANSVYSTGDSHIFLAINGIYEYRGGYTANLISQSIHGEWFNFTGKLDTARMNRSFIIYLEEYRELMFLCPAVNEAFPTDVLVLSLDSLQSSPYEGSTSATFRTRKFSTAITGAGVSTTQEAVTWASYIGKWDGTDGVVDTPWNATYLSVSAPTVVIGSTTSIENNYPIGVGADLISYNVAYTYIYTEYVNEFSVDDTINLTLRNGGSYISTILSIHSGFKYLSLANVMDPTTPYIDSIDPHAGVTLIGSYSIFTINYRVGNEQVDSGVHDGTPIKWAIETKDFTGFDKELRTDSVDVALQGVDADIDISRDGGGSWTNISTITQPNIKIRSRAHIQGVSNRFRLRFQGYSSAEIGALVIRYREEDRYRLG